jgi:hypothetical protein
VARRSSSRLFLLSPANCGGVRAKVVLAERASFPLAVRLRSSEGAAIGEVFSFLSGLYFRGKLTYARAFARPPQQCLDLVGGGVLVITPGAGLRAADTPISAEALRLFAQVDVSAGNRVYREPLEASARQVREAIGPRCEVVLLGSIASPKYVDVLSNIFDRRLVFPTAFVGRGDMSRGGLLLRSVTAGRELEYAPLIGAVRHGPRPPKLEPLRRRSL